jgi:hypothetical protein
MLYAMLYALLYTVPGFCLRHHFNFNFNVQRRFSLYKFLSASSHLNSSRFLYFHLFPPLRSSQLLLPPDISVDSHSLAANPSCLAARPLPAGSCFWHQVQYNAQNHLIVEAICLVSINSFVPVPQTKQNIRFLTSALAACRSLAKTAQPTRKIYLIQGAYCCLECGLKLAPRLLPESPRFVSRCGNLTFSSVSHRTLIYSFVFFSLILPPLNL